MSRRSQLRVSILHTVAGLASSAGGPSRTVPAICEALVQNTAARIRLVTTRRNAGDEILLPRDVESEVLDYTNTSPGIYARFAGFGQAVEHACRQHKCAIVHDHGQWLDCNRQTASVTKTLNIPRIVSPRGMLSPGALKFSRWKKRIAWLLYARRDIHTATLVHATSQLESEELRALGIKRPIAVIPNGFTLPGLNEPVTRKEKQMLFLSRVHPKKGLVDLVHAMSKLQMDGWKVVIAGPEEGNHGDQVRAEIQRLNLNHHFQWVGTIDGAAKTKLYRESTLFVLPTYSENFGVVVAEALACETPVITTTATPWISLQTHRCGWCVEPGVESLTNVLQMATAVPADKLREMGSRGRDFVTNEFSWPSIADQMHSVYSWVLNGGAPPECVFDD